MISIALLFVIFTGLPLILTISFRKLMIERKQRGLEQETAGLSGIQSWDLEALKSDVEKFFNGTQLSVPAIILTVIYALNFFLVYEFIAFKFHGHVPGLFPEFIVKDGLGMVFTFIGVYTFNFGSLVRRLYLVDLTEHVFWSAINRYVLSFGIAVILVSSGQTTKGDEDLKGYLPGTYFVVGYLSNFFLNWILQGAARANKLFDWSSQRAPEYSLQLIRGIDIWKEYRFEEEGIESVENLAASDLRTLAIKMRFPLRTLINWMDQAIVIHLLGKKAANLWENGIQASAIELAARSPANNNDSPASKQDVSQIAKALELPESNVEQIMNSLYHDQTVKALSRLWQRNRNMADVPAKTMMESEEPILAQAAASGK